MNWLTDTILRWDEETALASKLAAEGGITATIGVESDVTLAEWNDPPRVAGKVPVALTNGIWPGVSRAPTGRRDPDTWVAGASHQPWVDSNGYLISCLRAVRPAQPALLAHSPKNGVPFESVEIALVEAKVWGGNFLISLSPEYREGLRAAQPKAVQAWRKLGHTARWLTERKALFGHPPAANVTQIVESGGDTAELANLLYRHTATPNLVTVNAIPKPDSERCLALVAAGLSELNSPVQEAILNHARAGTTVITDTIWSVPGLRRIKQEEDRDFYSMGNGKLVAYHGAIADPSEFALDVIDIVTHKHRALRFWDAPAVVGLMTLPPTGPRALIHLVNYGEPREHDFPLRALGAYTKATLLRPDKPSIELKPAKRALTTEVRVPDLARVAVIALS